MPFPRTIRGRILAGCLVFATVPPALVALLDNAYARPAVLEDHRRALAAQAEAWAREVDNFLIERRQLVVLLAQQSVRDGFSDPRRISALLVDARAAMGSVLALTVTDSAGRVIASTNQSQRQGANAAPPMADRPSFARSRKQRTATISGVKRGHELGSDVVVEIAAPRLDANGRFIGIVEASLSVQQLSAASQGRHDQGSVIVVDSASRVAWASASAGLTELTDVSAAPFGRNSPSDALRYQRTLPGNRKAEPILAQRAHTRTGWQVIAELPERVALASVWQRELELLSVGLIGLGLALLFAWLNARRITESLDPLLEWMKSFDARTPTPPPVSEQASQELQLFAVRFRDLTLRLQGSYRALERTLTERESLNMQLRTVLSDLDRRVALRTRELEAALQRVEEGSRTKSRFLANMSHEVCTPLNAVIGFSSVLLKNRDGRFHDEELDLLRRIQANGRHLLGLVDDILDLSKIEAGRTSVETALVDVVELTRDTVMQMDGGFGEKALQLWFRSPVASLMIRSDAGKLRQILINLIGNAIKFTEQGSVTVEVVPDASGGALQSIVVEDTGGGIPADRQRAIFEPFEQADTSTLRRHAGTGLGLSISRSLAELLGAELTVRSTLGAGSTFALVFPRSASEEKAATDLRHERSALIGA